jgi:Ankyrin repeats (many copies)
MKIASPPKKPPFGFNLRTFTERMLNAATKGGLNNVPPSNLTWSGLTVRGKEGETPYYCAAKAGHLDQIPAHLLTRAAFALRDDKRRTPLHVAAFNAHLDQVPISVLQSSDMLLRSERGHTPLHWAARHQLEIVPRALLTRENLTIKTAFGQTPLDLAAAAGQLTKLPFTVLMECQDIEINAWQNTPDKPSEPKRLIHELPPGLRLQVEKMSRQKQKPSPPIMTIE